MEQLFYEAKPFLFLATSIAAHVHAPNAFTNTFALLLAACMGLVIYWRIENRYSNTSPARRPSRRK